MRSEELRVCAVPTTPAARAPLFATGSERLTPHAVPLTLYIHVPWCVRKCPYCDFNSHAARGDIPENAFLAVLETDLVAALASVWGRRIGSIFIGGGTPSLLSGVAVDRMLTLVRTLLPVEPLAEITLEANPGTAEAGNFHAFRNAGVNRLSLGIQSFDDARLAALGRIHDGAEARCAVDMALATFDNVNLDLMYALPGQSLADVRRDLQIAVDAGPAHLSVYHLTLEPNTAFGHAAPRDLPDDDLAADMQEIVEQTLAGAGFEHYETSAFARPGRRCRHNLNYWTFGDYLGIGPGAHSKLTFPDRIERQARVKHPEAWMNAAAAGGFLQSQEVVPAEAIPGEFMMNTLRLTEGFPLALYPQRTGRGTTTLLPGLEASQAKGLIERDALHVRPTPLGRRFLNDLIQIFLA